MTSSGKKAQRQETLDEQTITALEARRARLEELWR